jgi:hypothetical protein
VLRFLKDKLPQRLSDKVRNGMRLTRADMAEWHGILTHFTPPFGAPSPAARRDIRSRRTRSRPHLTANKRT